MRWTALVLAVLGVVAGLPTGSVRRGRARRRVVAATARRPLGADLRRLPIPGPAQVLLGRLALPIPPHVVLVGAVGVVVAGSVLGLVLAGLAGAVVGVALVVAVLAAGVVGVGDRRRTLVERALPRLLDQLGASLRTGASLQGGLGEARLVSRGPLADEVGRLLDRVDAGVPMAEALAGWHLAPGSTVARTTTAALTLIARAAPTDATVVDSLALTVREHLDLDAEVTAMATQARASAAVLLLAPVLFTALLGAADPGTLRFLTSTPAGLVCLLLGSVCDGLGAAWMARIVRAVV